MGILFVTLLLSSTIASADYSLSIKNLIPVADKVGAVDGGFLQSYKIFCHQPQFDVQKSWDQFGAQFSKEEARQLSLKIEKELAPAITLVKSELPTKKDVNLQVVILVGCRKSDATAIRSPQTTYVFFDLFKLFEQKRTSHVPTVFLVHEILHGIQSAIRPEYAPANYKTYKDHLLKFFVFEGAAGYFSQKITKSSDKDTYWPGMLTDAEYKSWFEYAQSQREKLGKRIAKYLKGSKYDEPLMQDIFYALNAEHLTQKRVGYLYGAEIIRQFDETHKKGLDFSYEEIEPYILKYFSISDK